MQSGLIYGNAAMLDGLIERIENELGKRQRVIATGGLADKIIPHCKKDIICDEKLILEGLRIIYNKNKKKYQGNSNEDCNRRWSRGRHRLPQGSEDLMRVWK